MARTNTKTNSKTDTVSPSRQRLSMTAENYLLSIYRLNEEDTVVTLTQLAEHLKMLPEGEGLGHIIANRRRYDSPPRNGKGCSRLMARSSCRLRRKVNAAPRTSCGGTA